MPNRRQTAPGPPRGIQSASVGLRILKVLVQAGGPLQLREIAAGAGMDASNAYRYLVSFCGAGLVAQGTDSRYDLGPFAIELGLAALSRIDGLDAAVKALAGLVDSVGLDGHVCVFGPAGVTVVRWLGRPREVVIRVSEGAILGPSASATGRLWGAFLDGALFEPLLAADLARRSAAGGASKKDLRAECERRIEAVRRVGLSLSRGERRVGIDALSGPVFDRDGSLAFSLTLMGPPHSFDARMNDVPARRLRETLVGISRELGAGRTALARYPWLARGPGTVPPAFSPPVPQRESVRRAARIGAMPSSRSRMRRRKRS
ncbi:MAG: helix-turn-helix domain-containing protein [Burkholderiales bacterium]|nr:helix-turn-helix domain-containing protein [Burkholderiales bacterium]